MVLPSGQRGWAQLKACSGGGAPTLECPPAGQPDAPACLKPCPACTRSVPAGERWQVTAWRGLPLYTALCLEAPQAGAVQKCGFVALRGDRNRSSCGDGSCWYAVQG